MITIEEPTRIIQKLLGAGFETEIDSQPLTKYPDMDRDKKRTARGHVRVLE
jgi:hypothetical protein